MIVIGIYGGTGLDNTGRIIKSILKGYGRDIFLCRDISQWKGELVQADRYEYAIIGIPDCNGIFLSDSSIHFDILVQVSAYKNSEKCADDLQRLINCVRQGGYVVINSDEIDSINFKCTNIYAVSYGLNSRATVTASSIDEMQGLSFSFYLQRAVPLLDGSIIQPFELPVTLQEDDCDLYSCLAAYTCVLILGFSF